MQLPVVPSTSTQRAATSRYAILVSELRCTEISYVAALKLLLFLKRLVHDQGALEPSAVDEIFGNVNDILDFHEGLLPNIEASALLPDEEQRWDTIFSAFINAADIYVTYIGNHLNHLDAAARYQAQLATLAGPTDVLQQVRDQAMIHLTFFRPYSRFAKYAVFIQEMLRYIPCEAQRPGLESALALHNSTMARASDVLHKNQLDRARIELYGKMEDWKMHLPSSFGELLLFQTLGCRARAKRDAVLEFEVYLFERIIIFCKKKKSGDRNVLRLKGRIYMQNISALETMNGLPHELAISWHGDDQDQTSVVRFQSRESMEKWTDKLRKTWERHKE